MMKKQSLLLLFSIFTIVVNAQTKKWSLQECIDYALEHNTTILQQKLSAQSSEKDILTARGAFYPTLNASASQNFNFGSYISNYGNRVSRNSSSNNFGMSTGVILYDGKRNINNLKLAKNQLKQSELSIEETKNNILLYVVNLYLSILLNKEAITVAEEQLKISKNQIKRTKSLVESGVKPKALLFESEANLAVNEEKLVNAKNNFDLAKLNLAQALQISSKDFDIEEIDILVDKASLTYKDVDMIFDKALSNFPEIKKSELMIENADLSYKIAKAGHYPTLSLGGGLGTSYQHLFGESDTRTILDESGKPVTIDNGFSKQIGDNFGYNVGLSLRIPIFNGFQTKVAVQKAKINKQRAEIQLIDQKLKLRKNIEKAYTEAKVALNQYLASKKSLIAQKESFKNAKESFNAGIMTSFDFEQVRNRMVNATSSMLNAKYNYVFKTKVLEYYYGIPIEIK
ncbi:MAG: TolC family protein [Flavobacteriaceae bacterium]|nr:TolC family protein [Flavobacteriaceae bacterium]